MFDITQSFYYLDAQTEEKKAEITQQQQATPDTGPGTQEEHLAPTLSKEQIEILFPAGRTPPTHLPGTVKNVWEYFWT